jgi:lipopolysaccharide/colanic/teichoic acid biosynthesis glycosyltransferase
MYINVTSISGITGNIKQIFVCVTAKAVFVFASPVYTLIGLVSLIDSASPTAV